MSAPLILPISQLLATLEPYARNAVYAWDLEAVRSARDGQMRGDFAKSADLAQAVKTDPAIFGALLNRIAPHRRLPRVTSVQDEALSAEVEDTFARDRPTIPGDADSFESVVQLGLSVEQIRWTPRADGSRFDVRLEPWPMNSVWYDPFAGKLKTSTTKGIVPIEHGNGRWVVTQQHSATPWEWGVIKSIGLTWVARAFHIRDRSNNSETHGEAKFIGTLAPQMDLNSAGGRALQDLVLSLRNRRAGGVKPPDTQIELLEAMGQMWQIFREAILSIDKDVARAYLGQDGSLTNEGGNYIKAAELAGVRYDIVEGDLSARGYALTSGLLLPWSQINFGRDIGAKIGWEIPDPDEAAQRESLGKRLLAFNEGVAALRKNGFEIDQILIDALAKQFGLDAPTLGMRPATRAEIFEYDLKYGIVTINEARQRKDLPPREGGEQTVPERDAAIAPAPAAPIPVPPAPAKPADPETESE